MKPRPRTGGAIAAGFSEVEEFPHAQYKSRLNVQPAFEIGSPGRARTSDPMINSHLLYQLSYRGKKAANTNAI